MLFSTPIICGESVLATKDLKVRMVTGSELTNTKQRWNINSYLLATQHVFV